MAVSVPTFKNTRPSTFRPNRPTFAPLRKPMRPNPARFNPAHTPKPWKELFKKPRPFAQRLLPGALRMAGPAGLLLMGAMYLYSRQQSGGGNNAPGYPNDDWVDFGAYWQVPGDVIQDPTPDGAWTYRRRTGPTSRTDRIYKDVTYEQEWYGTLGNRWFGSQYYWNQTEIFPPDWTPEPPPPFSPPPYPLPFPSPPPDPSPYPPPSIAPPPYTNPGTRPGPKPNRPPRYNRPPGTNGSRRPAPWGVDVPPNGPPKYVPPNHASSRPPRNVRETKVRSYMMMILGGTIDLTTELMDVFDSFREAHPDERIAKYMSTRDAYYELFVNGEIYNVDLLSAIENLANNHVEDAIVGRLMGAATKAQRDAGLTDFLNSYEWMI